MTIVTYKKLLLLAALPALVLASCTREDFASEPGNGPDAPDGQIRFQIGFAPQDGAAYATGNDNSSGAPATRVVTAADFRATWEDGDEIGLFAVKQGEQLATADNPIHNVRLTYSKANGTWNGKAYWPTAASGLPKLDFYAYYPYNEAAADPAAIAFSVHPDQNATTNAGGTEKPYYNLSDLLTAKSDNGGNGWGKGETVRLIFTHALAMVQVVLTADRKNNIGPVGSGISVTLQGVKTASTLDLGRQVVTASGDAGTVDMHRAGETAAGEPVFRALVPAQTVSGGYTFRLRQFNELYKAPGATTLQGGQAEKHGIKMPFIPTAEIKAGTFQMGSPDSDTQAVYQEKPQHEVTLSAFRIGKYEITREQYATFLNEAGVSNEPYEVEGYGSKVLFGRNDNIFRWNGEERRWEFTGDGDIPMSSLTWFGAKAYADWAGGSLPTEAQWEYACRAGSTTAYFFGDDVAELGDYAWHGDNSGNVLHPVGTKRPNPWGLYDMHGNVDEWCHDWYGNYAPDAVSDPEGPAKGSLRILRGGHSNADVRWLRSAYRTSYYPDSQGKNHGFRIVFP